MTEPQQLQRLTILNAITACVLMIGLTLENNFIPAICLLLLTFSFAGSVIYSLKARHTQAGDANQ